MINPPERWTRILRAVVPKRDRDHVTRELAELYRVRITRNGARAADRWYRREVLSFFQTVWIRNVPSLMRGGWWRGTIAALGPGLWQDVRNAVRGVRRNPGFSVLAATTLALGIGANVAVFSVINSVLMRPLSYPDSQKLVTIAEVHQGGALNAIAGANFVDWRNQSTSFDGLAAYQAPQPATILGGDSPARVPVASVSEDFFRLFGVAPRVGRVPTPAEHRASRPLVVVSERFWEGFLGSDPDVAQRIIRYEGAVLTVVGVMPQSFDFPIGTDIWLPIAPDPASSRTAHNWRGVGRLSESVTAPKAQNELSFITRTLKAEYGDEMNAESVRIESLREELVGDLRSGLRLLMGAAGFVLLIGCTNVAGMLLAQGTARRQEFTIRAALGAGRGRVLRQLFAEGAALSAVGTGLGLFLAWFLIQSLSIIAPSALTVTSDITMEGPVVVFAIVIGVMSVLLFAAIPAFRVARQDLSTGLRSRSGGAAAEGRAPVWRLLVGAEVALALVLLTGGALMGRSFWNVTTVDPGFDRSGVITMDLDLPREKFQDDQAIAAYYDELLAGVGGLTGVSAVGITNHLPLAGRRFNGGFEIDGQDPDRDRRADYRIVSENYFTSMGIPLLRGETFGNQHRLNTPHAVIINRHFAEQYFPGEDPVGRRIGDFANDRWIYGNQWATIIGVVGDVRHQDLTAPPLSEFYLYYRQRPARISASMMTIRSEFWSPRSSEQLHALVRRIDPDVPITVSSMSAILSSTVQRRRFTMVVLVTFAGVALLLAMVGVYGVISYWVTGLRREMGIRVALGAEPHDVRRLVLRHAMSMVAAGLGVGVLGTLGLSRVLQGWLYEVEATDLVTIVSMVALLGMAGWIASYLPARRSTKVDPMIAMRSE